MKKFDLSYLWHLTLKTSIHIHVSSSCTIAVRISRPKLHGANFLDGNLKSGLSRHMRRVRIPSTQTLLRPSDTAYPTMRCYHDECTMGIAVGSHSSWHHLWVGRERLPSRDAGQNYGARYRGWSNTSKTSRLAVPIHFISFARLLPLSCTDLHILSILALSTI